MRKAKQIFWEYWIKPWKPGYQVRILETFREVYV